MSIDARVIPNITDIDSVRSAYDLQRENGYVYDETTPLPDKNRDILARTLQIGVLAVDHLHIPRPRHISAAALHLLAVTHLIHR